jgi:hypothetical protein
VDKKYRIVNYINNIHSNGFDVIKFINKKKKILITVKIHPLLPKNMTNSPTQTEIAEGGEWIRWSPWDQEIIIF